ncbi:hypothetical protein BTI_5356 [Burkholderia thailandensis MSMB121]|uniref:DUF3540 domain-containing protein n=3 Tax=Burkholderia humptydooensis TaxID=430531 RepID=A0A7U4SVF4_9BURK|nr:DUF3540 domain-containing protein [Burkholderia humptydooensis]AGK49990.1 hypothetical protein BTI_5356 [Burkholderia thailandensis MSMB121]ATF33205.1 DUF3540 domain-containing protein [Burkholderia thailandensis]ALX46225.1 type VI secretion protein [Burkholderia humptydooensis]KST71287.1 type VI secretion protein [Burkholderia humptydooensis]QPS47732.1 DUF3540 domain-containing protein [Burkholderia humptydooensis]
MSMQEMAVAHDALAYEGDDDSASRRALTRIMKGGGRDADASARAASADVPARESAPPANAAATTALARIDGERTAADEWRVALRPGVVLRAKKAVSCVVAPRAGDLVQICREGERCWVLAVLERGGASDEANDRTNDEVTLDFGDAHVALRARDVRVEARDRLSLEAAQLASRAQVVTQAAAERQTHVSGTDATHAGSTVVHTERHMAMHAKSAAVTAASLLKIDAGQIHMG